MRLHFYGAVGGSVTGSNYLLEIGGKKILVDCGLFQSSHFYDDKNFEPFPYKPEEIDAVFVTHAHIDHTGRLPKLVRSGFRGNIYSTPPTKDFAEPLLMDEEHVQHERAERGEVPLLYEPEDVDKTLKLWRGITYHEPVKIGGVTATFYDAGHILGSSFVLLEENGVKIVFSGDLGNTPAPIIKATESLNEADYCVIESTYGGTIREDPKGRDKILAGYIKEAVARKGVLMIPAFSMERTQEILFSISGLIERREIPDVPIYLDSPLGIKLTDVFIKYRDYFNKAAENRIKGGEKIFSFPGLTETPTSDQSKAINDAPAPKVIISSSGMSQGGRIMHHERRYLQDPKNSILFVGYQAEGTLGRRILDGAPSVRIFGEEIPVRAKVEKIGSYSAHADQPRLINWLRPMAHSLKKIFIVHGEADQSLALSRKIKEELKISSELPAPDSSYDII